MKRWAYLLAGIGILLSGASGTAGSYATFATRAAFEAKTYDRQTIDFEGLALPAGVFTAFPNLELQGATFTGVIPGDYYLFVIDPAEAPDLFDWGSGASLLGPPSFDDGSHIQVDLPPGITAFGTDLSTVFPDGAPFQITLADGQTFAADTTPFPDRAFFGVVADSPIDSISFVAGEGAFPLLDNFTFGLAAPLPPSFFLFGFGAAGLAAVRIRTRRTKDRRPSPTACAR